MNNMVPDGVWPTMITPFTDDNKVDFKGLEELIEWYIKADVDGLFAVCQSSEMFYLSYEEREEIAKFVKQKVGKRTTVVSTGTTSKDTSIQIKEIDSMIKSGISNLVLLTNTFASQNESDEIWKSNVNKVLKEFPKDVVFGLYECPYPYKRVLSPDMLRWCALSERFIFLKDTCCDPKLLRLKLDAVKDSNLKIFNASAATLLQSLKDGASGFCGILTNFCPELFVWLTRNWKNKSIEADKLQNFLGSIAAIEKRLYPICAKQFLKIDGVNISVNTRANNIEGYLPAFAYEVEQLHSLIKEYRSKYIK